jgi:glycosyltransferase involved in cell wall biosynthesis
VAGLRRLKVLQLITGLEIGGAERLLLDTVRHLDNAQFQSVVACLYNNGRIGRQIAELGIPVADMHMRSFADPCGLMRLLAFLHQEKPDILHTHLFRANVWGRLLGAAIRIPVIVSSEHSLTEHYFEGRRRTPWLTGIDNLTARCCKVIIANSHATKKYLVENGVRLEKIEVIHNGVDTRGYTGNHLGSAIRTEFGLDSAKLVTMVGRLHPQKNHRLLIEAFAQLHARLPQTKLLIVGEGPLEEELRMLGRAQAPGAIIFAGARSDIPAIMAASDLVMLPSRWEPFGIVLVEAMSAGKPVIGTAVDGIPEVIVDGKTGLLVRPGDAAALADAMFGLLNDPARATRMGELGRARARRQFDIRKAVADLQLLYLRLYSCAHA